MMQMMSVMSSKTLFVRNLPYSTSDSQLEEHFSRHGPLKACFTVKEKGTHDRCRGFGYVTYQSSEDAEKARLLVKMVGSRPVQIVYAKQREPRKKTKDKKSSTDVANNKEGEGDDAINRDRIDGVAINRSSTADYDSDTSDGEELVENVDQTDSEDDYETLTAKRSGVSNDRVRGKHKRKTERGEARFDTGRVVVLGDLPVERTSEKKLRKECERLGKVESIEYPVPGKEIPSAYITYSTHKEARLAVSQLHGQSFGNVDSKVTAQLLSREGKRVSKKSLKKSRLIVRNLSFKCSEDDVRSVFEKYGKLLEVHIPRKPNGRMLGYAFVQFGSYFAAKNALEAVNMTEVKGRPVAVDWVVPKEQYEQSVKQEEADKDRKDEEMLEIEAKNEELDSESHDSDAESHDSGTESHNSDSESHNSDTESHDSAAKSHDNTDMDTEEEFDALKRDDVKEGWTLFIRNLPLTVDHKELKQLFYEFGRVCYCRVMFNPDTGLCTGSAFVQFQDASSVQSCLKACSSQEQGISYGGQRLEVTLALSRGEVEKVCQERGAEGRRGRGEDKRNLYLAKEGVILPGSEAAGELSKTDMARRMKVYSQKKLKLVNPYFFVSRTRLSIHNLPVNVDEQRLKRVFLQVATTAAAGNSEEARVTQVKILRSSERVNSKGIGRSLGYGFIEFSSHEAALAALRATNNNPAIFGEKRRLIVEFAVEDSRALKLRERRRQRQLMKPSVNSETKVAGDEAANTKSAEKPLSRRQKWRLKCRAKRLRRRERRKKLMSESIDTEEKQTERTKAESAISFKLHTDDKEQQLHNAPTPVVSHNHSQTHKLVQATGTGGGSVGSRKVKVQRTGQHPGVKLSRKRKRKGMESSKEEAEFAEMVAKYRRKLQMTTD